MTASIILVQLQNREMKDTLQRENDLQKWLLLLCLMSSFRFDLNICNCVPAWLLFNTLFIWKSLCCLSLCCLSLIIIRSLQMSLRISGDLVITFRLLAVALQRNSSIGFLHFEASVSSNFSPPHTSFAVFCLPWPLKQRRLTKHCSSLFFSSWISYF